MAYRNRSLMFSFMFTLLIAFAVIYFFSKHKSINPNPSQNQIFSPDDIKTFIWNVGELRLEHVQTSPGVWKTNKSSERVTAMVSFLSRLSPLVIIDPLPPDMNKLVSVTLNMNNGTAWKGRYSDDIFVWTDGPLQNKGIELSAEDIVPFQEGQFAFDTLDWKICNNEIKKIFYEVNEEEIALVKKNNTWTIARLGGNSRKLRGEKINMWAQKLCAAKVKAWLDLDSEPFGLDDGNFSITFLDEKKVEFRLSGSSVEIDDHRAALSPEIVDLLEELLIIIEPE